MRSARIQCVFHVCIRWHRADETASTPRTERANHLCGALSTALRSRGRRAFRSPVSRFRQKWCVSSVRCCGSLLFERVHLSGGLMLSRERTHSISLAPTYTTPSAPRQQWRNRTYGCLRSATTVHIHYNCTSADARSRLRIVENKK